MARVPPGHPRRARRGARARRARDLLRRGRRGARRRVRRHRRPAGARTGTERVFDTPISELALAGAAFGSAVMRPAPGGRDHVRRLPAAGHGQPGQPGRQVLVHLQRAGERAARRALRGRRRRALRRDPLAEPDQLVPRRARAEDRRAVDAARRQGAPRRRRSATTTRCSSSSTSACTAMREERRRVDPVIGRAAIVRRGTDITLVSAMKTVHDCLAAAELLAEDGIDAEVHRPAHAAPARPRERSSRRSRGPTGSRSWRRAR